MMEVVASACFEVACSLFLPASMTRRSLMYQLCRGTSSPPCISCQPHQSPRTPFRRPLSPARILRRTLSVALRTQLASAVHPHNNKNTQFFPSFSLLSFLSSSFLIVFFFQQELIFVASTCP